MIKRVDSEVVKKEGELLPGKDIRIRGNAWIRASFRDAGLERVPREPQVRYALQRVVKKKKLGYTTGKIYIFLLLHL